MKSSFKIVVFLTFAWLSSCRENNNPIQVDKGIYNKIKDGTCFVAARPSVIKSQQKLHKPWFFIEYNCTDFENFKFKLVSDKGADDDALNNVFFKSLEQAPMGGLNETEHGIFRRYVDVRDSSSVLEIALKPLEDTTSIKLNTYSEINLQYKNKALSDFNSFVYQEDTVYVNDSFQTISQYQHLRNNGDAFKYFSNIIISHSGKYSLIIRLHTQATTKEIIDKRIMTFDGLFKNLKVLEFR